jgi:hypothetical protein
MGALPPTRNGIDLQAGGAAQVFMYVTMASYAYIPDGPDSYRRSVFTEDADMLKSRLLDRSQWTLLSNEPYKGEYSYTSVLCQEGHIAGHKNEFDTCSLSVREHYHGSYFLNNTALQMCACHFETPNYLEQEADRLLAREMFLRQLMLTKTET